MEGLIKQKVDLIAECIHAKVLKNKQNDSYGLYTGEFGLLLFILYYSKYSQNKKYILFTEKCATELLEQFVQTEKKHTFCSGFAGELYLFEYLREKKIIELNIGPIHSILNNYLVFHMRQDIKKQYYDFMHGAIGVGLYLLKMNSHSEYVQELIEFLYSTAEKDYNKNIFKWVSFIDSKKTLIGYNLSMSHGISSIIIFLSRVIKRGISDKKVIMMLSGAVNFLLSQEKDIFQFGSHFPPYITDNSSEKPVKSRLAWCYGDLGIGMALWQAGKVLGKNDWKEKATQILIASTNPHIEQNNVIDAGICHGSAGLVMIYNRMFVESNDNRFKDATRYWLNQTLSFSHFKDGLAGYKTFSHNEWRYDYSLLTGITGIGLVFMSQLDGNQQEWDELFLLS